MQTDTSDATLTTVLITAKTATAAALITLKSAATKPTPPKQNAPTADPLNIKADFFPPETAVYIIISKISFLQGEYHLL